MEGLLRWLTAAVPSALVSCLSAHAGHVGLPPGAPAHAPGQMQRRLRAVHRPFPPAHGRRGRDGLAPFPLQRRPRHRPVGKWLRGAGRVARRRLDRRRGPAGPSASSCCSRATRSTGRTPCCGSTAATSAATSSGIQGSYPRVPNDLLDSEGAEVLTEFEMRLAHKGRDPELMAGLPLRLRRPPRHRPLGRGVGGVDRQLAGVSPPESRRAPLH